MFFFTVKSNLATKSEQIDCLIIVMLTHGNDESVYTQDQAVLVDSIMSFFSAENCEELILKPKIFIFQVRKDFLLRKLKYFLDKLILSSYIGIIILTSFLSNQYARRYIPCHLENFNRRRSDVTVKEMNMQHWLNDMDVCNYRSSYGFQ